MNEPNPPAQPTVVLATTALTRRFGAFTAVDALTLSVNAGETFALLGSNGAARPPRSRC